MSYDSTKKRIIDTYPEDNRDGVSVHDVQQALSITANQLKDLCTSDKINKWAAFKPISRPNISPIDVSSNLRNYYSEGSGEGGEICGIKGLRWLGVSFDTFINGNNSTYPKGMVDHFNPQDEYYNDGTIYVKPEGGENSPYRINDFVLNSRNNSIIFGYKHDAQLIHNYNSNGVTHTITSWSRTRNSTPYEYLLNNIDIIIGEQPDGYSENWEGYSGVSFLTKRLENLTEEDEKIRLHDLIYAQWPGITSASNLRHGILLHDPDDLLTWIFIGRIPLDNTTSERSQAVKDLIATTRSTLATYTINSGKTLHCVDFLTDAPETAGTTTSNVYFDTNTTGTYNFVPIPSYIGYIYFKSDAGAYSAQINAIDGAYYTENHYINGYKANPGYLFTFILNSCSSGAEPEGCLIGISKNSGDEERIPGIVVYDYDDSTGRSTTHTGNLIVGNWYSLYISYDDAQTYWTSAKIAVLGKASSSSSSKTPLTWSDFYDF